MPIYAVDNPSRDFFFPITQKDIENELEMLPQDDWEGITHIWLRRFKKSEYEEGELPLAEFSCGSGVRLITLYPWPRDKLWIHGNKKPSKRLQKIIASYGALLVHENANWVSQWENARLKDFYIEYLLFHEIGHHIDWYFRHWSKTNKQILEEAANQYAYARTTLRSFELKNQD